MAPTRPAGPSTARSSPAIRYEHKILLLGTTGCGKSTFARKLYLSSAAPRLVIDPADSSLTVTPGCVTFTDPGRRLNKDGDDWHAAASARFVPTDPDDLAAYDAVYRWAFENFPRWVWCDEAATVLPVRSAPTAGRRFIVQGRKRRLGHLACSTRPREINRGLISEAAHIGIWPLPNVEDRRHVAGVAGVDLATLEAELAALPTVESSSGPKSGFLWLDVGRRELIACPPLKL